MRLPWTQLSASPHTVLFRRLSFVDHAAPNAARRWTTGRPRTGTTQRWENAALESQIERRRRVITGSVVAWGCSLWRITGGVEGWRDSLAGGGVALRSDAC